MREKYESLSLLVLRDLAKARGLKGISTLRKPQLVERMLQADEEEKENKERTRQEASGQQGETSESEDRPYVPAGERMETTYGDTRTARGLGQEPSRAGEGRAVYRTPRMGGPQQGTRNISRTYQGQRPARPYSNRDQGRDYPNRDQGRDYPNRDQGRDYSNRDQGRDYPNRDQGRDYPNRDQGRDYPNRDTGRDYQNHDQSRDYQGRDYQGRDQGADYLNRDQGSGENGVRIGANTGRGNYSAANAQRLQQMNAVTSEQEDEAAVIAQESDDALIKENMAEFDSGLTVNGILEVMPDGFGFIRSDNYMPGENDVYVAPAQIRRFNLKTGDIVCGNTRIKTEREKFSALLYVSSVNGLGPSEIQKRPNFEHLTPVFPNERLRLERPGCSVAMRVVDLVSPIGKGQRGMIVSQPKAGKTTLLKEIAKSILINNPEMHLIILLVDERPEEVTDIREAIRGENVEVIYSTFDELPEHHKRVSEMVIERAKRLVEHRQDVIILLDSITRLARAYNLTVPPSGRTLSGGLDPAALHMPKRFFGAARNMREGGSLTILATALVDTGSKMDDVVFEEFKGTGNMELVLDRKLSEKRIFPAIDMIKSGTRRDDLLLDPEELAALDNMHRAFNGARAEDAVENMLNMFAHTRDNREVVNNARRNIIL